jgi:choline dehydrogenase-like flavoprotein
MGREFKPNEEVDVLVVGTGAGGGNIIRELCLNGVSVVALEAGSRLVPEKDFENDEWSMSGKLTWADPILTAGDRPNAMATWTCKTVGGSTVHWTGNALRPSAYEFRALSTYGPIDGTSLVDWPVSLEELEPWYEKAEKYMGVTGRVQASQVPSANYLAAKKGTDRLGLNIRPTNMALNAHGEYDGRPGCTQRGHCMQGCSNSAMWSTLTEAIPKAEKTGWLDLRTNCQALTVNTDKTGRAVSVTYARSDGTIEEQRAKIIVLAGNSIQTPRILLNSANSLHPNGLANSSGMVGKNYMHHVTGTAFGQMPFEVHGYMGITTTGIIEDFHDFRPGKNDFVGGFNIVNVFMGPPAMAIFGQPGPMISHADARGGWGKSLAEMMDNYTYLAGLHFIGEDMPQERNGVTLHPTDKDKFGIPVPTLSFFENENDNTMREFAWKKADEIFDAAGATKSYRVPPFPDTHLLGTCRMGDDPQTSVLNRWGATHDIDNLYVADGSVFPTSTAENPALTISALAIRQADHIMSRMASLDV